MNEQWRLDFYRGQEQDRLEAEANREAGLARQRISRAEGKERRRLRDLERGALGRAKSTSERRRIKDEIAELQASLKNRSKEERGKVSEGTIYDVKTHEEPSDNKGSADTSVDTSNGIDEIKGDSAAGDSTGSLPEGVGSDDFNFGGFGEETLTICVNGQPENRIFLTKE